MQKQSSYHPEFSLNTRVMKRSLKEKFKRHSFVQPLYKNVRPKNSVAFQTDSVKNRDGRDFEVNRNNLGRNTNLNNVYVNVPGICENCKGNEVKTNNIYLRDNEITRLEMLESIVTVMNSENAESSKVNKEVQVRKISAPQFDSDSWLRVYPLPALPKESVCSCIIRCLVCQIGLATFLTLWTVLWVFMIQSFEGPYEIKVSVEFEKEQAQLVIDLATELRQITPLSPKWRLAIERRILEERQLTILAIGRGARVLPGQFWDIPGTFLFCVYVMTALGFGAPVPQTLWGRSSALIYAILAVPMHIYLMVNSSTCMVHNVSTCNLLWKKQMNSRSDSDEGVPTSRDNKKESTNCSRNSEMIKTSSYGTIRRKFMSVLSLLCAWHGVPFAVIAYYAIGAIVFGVLRSKPPLDVIIFPVEFTTTGGLEHIEGCVRLVYGLYVEGTMMLITCALATLRRRSSNTITYLVDKYRLFQIDV